MKTNIANEKVLLAAMLLASVTLFHAGAFAQDARLTDDSYINPGGSTNSRNYGAASTMALAGSSSASNIQKGYVKFDLSVLPAGTTAVSVTKAVLTLYASSVTTAGSFNVQNVTGNWSEMAITAANQPLLGGIVATGVPVASDNAFVSVDVTSAVQSWLNVPSSNKGLALMPNTTGVNVSFDTKESSATGHQASLEIFTAVSSGAPGATGATGPAGPTGPPGVNGLNGARGATGAAGPIGPAGSTGPKGDTGAAGPTGATGAKGVNWLTTWNSGAIYNPGDAFQYHGTSYITRLSNSADTSAEPGTIAGNSFFDVFAAIGATGPTGAKGDTGDKGADSTVPGPVGPSGPAGAASTVPGPTGPTGPAGQPGVGLNPLQVATLHWYDAISGLQFPVGSSPWGVAFDGANIWVANFGSSNVTKLRASDGALLGTIAVGGNPRGVAFDGANIWVANQGSHNVTKLRASDGAVQGTFAVSGEPAAVAFDGANIWVALVSTNNVTKLRASDGALQGTFAVGSSPTGVAFDGANIWVANVASSNVTKLRASDGAVLGTFAVGFGPMGMAFDGANIWVANASSGSMTKLRASDGAVLGTFGDGFFMPLGVAFDGANIWVTDYFSNTVFKM